MAEAIRKIRREWWQINYKLENGFITERQFNSAAAELENRARRLGVSL